MKQKQALDILKLGHNVYLTGAAGSGKTFLLNQYIKYLKENKVPVAVTASTGIAATHMNGRTIHSWSGMGINKSLTDSQIRELADKDYIYKNVVNTSVLIIDEVSMLDALQLDLINRICQILRDNDLAFGGLQVILSGDFFQLPPIRRGDESGHFVTASDIWQKMDLTVCYLTEQYRQNDQKYYKLLQDIRNNSTSKETRLLLNKRLNAKIKTKLQVTKLYSHNIDVDYINNLELNKLKEESTEYEMTYDGNRKMIESLKSSSLVSETLILKKGAVVMFVKNNFLKGYVNGTLGQVIGFDHDTSYPVIKTFSGKEIIASPESWRIEEKDRVIAEIRQIPLRLAWAITIHKCQGMSLDIAEIDLSKSFVCGMGYVALSRVKSLSGIVLKGINDFSLKVDNEVLEIDQTLLKKSQDSLQTLGQLSPKEIKKNHQQFIADKTEVVEDFYYEDDDDVENEYDY